MTDETNTITVCPECKSSKIRHATTRTNGVPGYRCKDCEERFDEPAEREAYGNGDQSFGSPWVQSLIEEANADD